MSNAWREAHAGKTEGYEPNAKHPCFVQSHSPSFVHSVLRSEHWERLSGWFTGRWTRTIFSWYFEFGGRRFLQRVLGEGGEGRRREFHRDFGLPVWFGTSACQSDTGLRLVRPGLWLTRPFDSRFKKGLQLFNLCHRIIHFGVNTQLCHFWISNNEG